MSLYVWQPTLLPQVKPFLFLSSFHYFSLSVSCFSPTEWKLIFSEQAVLTYLDVSFVMTVSPSCNTVRTDMSDSLIDSAFAWFSTQFITWPRPKTGTVSFFSTRPRPKRPGAESQNGLPLFLFSFLLFLFLVGVTNRHSWGADWSKVVNLETLIGSRALNSDHVVFSVRIYGIFRIN